MQKTMVGDNPPPYSEVVQGNPPIVGIIDPNMRQATTIPPPMTYQYASAPPPHGFVPSYGAISAPPTAVIGVPTEILVIGGCPSCRIGFLEDYYSCLGVLCAIAFFPLGVLCCLAMKTKRCSNCGAEF